MEEVKNMDKRRNMKFLGERRNMKFLGERKSKILGERRNIKKPLNCLKKLFPLNRII